MTHSMASMAKPSSISLGIQALIFLVIFTLLQWIWAEQRNSELGYFLIEGLTVKSAVALVNLFTPSIAVTAQGTHMSATGGGINVYSGCEGVEVMFLLIAALAIAPISWRAKLAGMFVGVVYVFLINQMRLVVMFYAVRADKHLFELIHGMVAPIILVGLTGLFFACWLAKYTKATPAITKFAMTKSVTANDTAN